MHILVTGASRGIGYELVKRFSLNESNKIIAISRNLSRLQQLQNECSREPYQGNVGIKQCDLQNKKDVAAAVKEVDLVLGNVDVLVNNAGYLFHHSFEHFPEEEMRKIFDINVFGMVSLIQKMLPMLTKSVTPHIVNISSMGGFQGSSKFPGLSMYSASKGAVSVLTECLAEELKDRNVSVNCLALGAVQTEMLEEAFPGYKPPMDAAQMAEFIEDFSLNGAKYFNGKILPVNLSTP